MQTLRFLVARTHKIHSKKFDLSIFVKPNLRAQFYLFKNCSCLNLNGLP